MLDVERLLVIYRSWTFDAGVSFSNSITLSLHLSLNPAKADGLINAYQPVTMHAKSEASACVPLTTVPVLHACSRINGVRCSMFSALPAILNFQHLEQHYRYERDFSGQC